MKQSLRQRILAWSAAGTIGTVLAVLLLVDSTFRATVRQDVEQQIVATTRLTGELQASRFRDLLGQGASVAMNPVLRGSVETGDPSTVRATLEDLLGWAGLDWLAVLSAEGDLLAAAGNTPDSVAERAAGLLDQALYYDTGDLWVAPGGLIEVVASGIYFGASPLGVLLGGASIRQPVVEELEQTTLQHAGFVANGRVVAVSMGLPPEKQEALDRLAQAGLVGVRAGDRADTVEYAPLAIRRVELAGETFLLAGLPLQNAAGEVVGEVINLRSLHGALAPVRRLRATILALAFIGLLLAALSSWLLSRSVIRPVHRLLADARRMGDGDLDQPVAAVSVDEIGALALGFENMRTSLRDAREQLIRSERLSAIGRAAGAIVHDFAQPITVLMGHVQLAQEETDPAARNESLAIMRTELDRLRAMMNEILEFTRGEKHLVRLPVSVPAMIDDIVRGLAPGLRQRDIRLAVAHGYDGEWPLDVQRMNRVLHNLIGNAATAIGRDGDITIRTSRVDGSLRIAVSDNGPGIPPAIRDTLFEPFVTGSRGGTGLGLAIVKNIIERQDGTIRVATSEAGTSFIMEISDLVERAPVQAALHDRVHPHAAAAAAVLLLTLATAARVPAQTVFSGQVDLVAKSNPDRYGLNRTFRGNPYNEFRLRGFARTWMTDRIGFFGEVMFDGRYSTPFINGAYVVINEIGGRDWLNARLGLAPSLIGNFGQRSTYFNVNPLVGVPLVWSHFLTIDGTGFDTIEALQTSRAANQRGIPVLYDACWNMQWELLGEVGAFEYSIGVTPASMSNPRSSTQDGLQLLARIGAEPTPGLRIGVSGGRGPYIGVAPTSTARVIDNPEDYDQRLVGLDLEFSRGRTRVFAEAYASEWEVPGIEADLGVWSSYVEARYAPAPGWYVAARLDQMAFLTGETPGGRRFRWDDDLWRIESAVGYRLTREMLVKLDWQHTRFTTGARRRQDLLSIQLSASF